MDNGDMKVVGIFFFLVLLALCCQCQVVDEKGFQRASEDISTPISLGVWSLIGWLDISDLGDAHFCDLPCQPPRLSGVNICNNSINPNDFKLWYICICACLEGDHD